MNGISEDCSWEDIYDSGQLDEQLANFDTDHLESIVAPPSTEPAQNQSSVVEVEEVVGGGGGGMVVKSSSDKPIKILKRSENNGDGEVETVNPENRQMIEQSVAQREKDYAAARERIMGTRPSNKAAERGRAGRNNYRRNQGNSNNGRQPG